VLFRDLSDPDALPRILSWIIAITVNITVHEFAHAKRAQLAGDPTPEMNNRVTLNPLAHYDIIGTTAIFLVGMGWGKPVPVNPMNFRRPRYDEIMVSAWGGFANLITAAVFGVAWQILRSQGLGEEYAIIFHSCVFCGLMLAFFNFIPIYPLDGSHILIALLPTDKAMRLETWYRRFGMILLMALIFLPFRGPSLAWRIIQYPVEFLYQLLMGLPFFFF
jgi:Zn-dependent protease